MITPEAATRRAGDKRTTSLVDIPFSGSTVHKAVVIQVAGLLILQPLALFFFGLHALKHDAQLRDFSVHYVIQAGVGVFVDELPTSAKGVLSGRLCSTT